MFGFLIDVGRAYLLTAGLFLILLAAELALPKGALPSKEARIRAIVFALVFIPVAEATNRLFAYPRPLLSFPALLSIPLAALLYDFFYYWLHRAQHAMPFLWRLHAVHHSVEELGALGGYHHVSEAPLKALLVAIPAALFLPLPSGLVGFLIGFHGIYLHSATRLNFGRFAKVIADNRTHRIHHSLEARHFDKNFGALTMLWDRLFGTAYFPKANEWPDTGLADHPEPRSVREYLLPGQLEGTRGKVGTV